MAFPNVDKIIVAMLAAKFTELQQAPEHTLADLFGDLPLSEHIEIETYIMGKIFETDVKSREGNKVYILTTSPRLDMPFPQISVTLGQEDTDRYMGDNTGTSTEVRDAAGALIGWDVEKGFYAKTSYSIMTVTATKDEAIWLTRLIQRFIFEEMTMLESKGIMQIDLSTADMQPAPDQQPIDVCNRTIRFTATTANTWTKRVLYAPIQEGANNALAAL